MCFRVFQKLKKRGLALKSYGLLSIFCISFLVVSCSTDKENQDILGLEVLYFENLDDYKKKDVNKDKENINAITY